ncbi:MAG: 16S rRNA (cytosine(967)-C(5))-methyltransferase RsmB [Deltaproteobacteria bacterium]|nr:16S rRNA (cytosine(967)-C(5))-methyltransferase RsmB [Deltaproteobacteria bacterium]
MKPAKPRTLALQALNKSARRPAYSDEILNDIFHRHPTLDQRDISFLNQLVKGVLRWRLRLDWIIEQFADLSLRKIDPHVLNILRIALYQILFLGRIPESAAVNEAVQQAKADKRTRHGAPFVNGILRQICREKGGITFPDRDEDIVQYISITHSYPEWLVRKWIHEIGVETAENLMQSQNQVPNITIRVNTLKMDREGFIKKIAQEGVVGKPAPYSPDGVILEDLKGRIDLLPSFRQGFFQVQDEAAQIVTHLLRPRPGESILDVGAGLGGKSTHLAEVMKDHGRIVALDKNLDRLINLGRNAHRLGIKSILPLVGDASRTFSFRCLFDKIIVDAPCSGLGVLSRHPDGKWNRDEHHIKRLALMQKSILSQAASFLKKGGYMLYVTCTISKEENEDVAMDLLGHHKALTLKDLREYMPDWGKKLVNDQGFFRTFPHVHQMDGFFGALFFKG